MKSAILKKVAELLHAAADDEPSAPSSTSNTAVAMGFRPVDGDKIAKAVDEDEHLVTAIVLRPDEVDLHGHVYDTKEVEKACHNFNVYCRQGNLQHVQMEQSIEFVESYIAPADFLLGEGQVRKGDWVATMRVPDESQWKAVKSGAFTGFSIGCMATIEELK